MKTRKKNKKRRKERRCAMGPNANFGGMQCDKAAAKTVRRLRV